jgi:dihydrofolate reductase
LSLHDWLFHGSDADREAGAAMLANTGAVLIGRRTFDIGIEEWRDDACSALGPGWFEHHGEQRVELERTGIVETAAATHLTFRVAR